MSRSTNDELLTPSWVLSSLGEFDLDPCAGESTQIAKTNWWIGRGEDGLERPWSGVVFCNPPFSQKEKWIEKMIAHGKGILLLPERGSAPWFGPLAVAACTYFVLGKKIDFIGGSSSANIGTCLFAFGIKAQLKLRRCDLPGLLVKVEKFNPRKS